jgi:hypothetical protein
MALVCARVQFGSARVSLGCARILLASARIGFLQKCLVFKVSLGSVPISERFFVLKGVFDGKKSRTSPNKCAQSRTIFNRPI